MSGDFVFSVGDIHSFSGKIADCGEISGKVIFTKLDTDAVLATISAETNIETICARCGKSLQLPIRIRYDEEFARSERASVDLEPSLRDEILLAEPLKPTHKSCKIPKY
jgi:uncharacterized metal-binding protein YceD (DUF177 family)